MTNAKPHSKHSKTFAEVNIVMRVRSFPFLKTMVAQNMRRNFCYHLYRINPSDQFYAQNFRNTFTKCF